MRPRNTGNILICGQLFQERNEEERRREENRRREEQSHGLKGKKEECWSKRAKEERERGNSNTSKVRMRNERLRRRTVVQKEEKIGYLKKIQGEREN